MHRGGRENLKRTTIIIGVEAGTINSLRRYPKLAPQVPYFGRVEGAEKAFTLIQKTAQNKDHHQGPPMPSTSAYNTTNSNTNNAANNSANQGEEVEVELSKLPSFSQVPIDEGKSIGAMDSIDQHNVMKRGRHTSTYAHAHSY